MPPAARIGDMHTCPMVNPGPVPHVGGPIIKGAVTVLTGMMPQARVGDMLTCVGPPDTIAKGSLTVQVEYMPAARLGDLTVHGGVIVTGFPMVMIGDVGMGSVVTSDGMMGIGALAGAFMAAAAEGGAMVCKGPCEACGQA
jgi:uncharacterized Zn-binding protein involved in type VI secretion